MAVAVRVALVLLDRRTLQWLLWLAAGGFLAVVVLVGGVASVQQSPPAESAGPSAVALADIPGPYLSAYQAAAAKFGLDWAILAGIGKVECDHGRDPDPSCGTPGAENPAGAGGPMQFLAATWSQYGIDPAGHPARADGRWNYADAISSAANYLHASGAPGDYQHAIFAYNHASWYVAEVEQWAAKYRAAAATAVPVGQVIPGAVARIDPRTGQAIPAAADPPVVKALIIAGDQIITRPYPEPDTHYDGDLSHPWPAYDCSGSVSYVLYMAGLHGRMADVSGSLESWGEPGPGRWVTVYANAGHTFIEVAGVVLNTAWYGPVQPQTPGSGPRWQPASTVAGQIRGDGYGGFVQRHPAGL